MLYIFLQVAIFSFTLTYICSVSVHDAVHAHDLGRDEAIQDLGGNEANQEARKDDVDHDKLSIGDKVLQKQLQAFTDSATGNTVRTIICSNS